MPQLIQLRLLRILYYLMGQKCLTPQLQKWKDSLDDLNTSNRERAHTHQYTCDQVPNHIQRKALLSLK
jgi:hypothetical protein